jgi:transcription elongation factor Elf1
MEKVNVFPVWNWECPGCGELNEVDEDHSEGATVECGKCGKQFQTTREWVDEPEDGQ